MRLSHLRGCLDSHRGLWLKRRTRHLTGRAVRAGLQDTIIIRCRRPDHTNHGPLGPITIHGWNGVGQVRQMPYHCVHRDVRHALETQSRVKQCRAFVPYARLLVLQLNGSLHALFA